MSLPGQLLNTPPHPVDIPHGFATFHNTGTKTAPPGFARRYFPLNRLSPPGFVHLMVPTPVTLNYHGPTTHTRRPASAPANRSLFYYKPHTRLTPHSRIAVSPVVFFNFHKLKSHSPAPHYSLLTLPHTPKPTLIRPGCQLPSRLACPKSPIKSPL